MSSVPACAVCAKSSLILNSGSQPFAIVSSCIRSHLRRRGMTATNSSSGRPFAPKLPPPLFASYELAGQPDPKDIAAIGIEREAKPAVKRGTLWYMSEEGTGYASPFGERDPNLPENLVKQPVVAVRNKAATRRQSLPTSNSLPNLSSFPPRSPETAMSPMYEDDEGEDAMGRGKRKRKASSIAGGDSSWQTSHNKHNLTINTSASASASPPPSSHRRAESSDSLRPARESSSGIKRIKVRLSALAESPTSTNFDSALDSDASMDLDPGQAAARDRRKNKKRSKSEGSLLSLAPAAMHYRPPPSALSASLSQRSESPEEGLHSRAWSAEPVSRSRPGLLDSLIGRRVSFDLLPIPKRETDAFDQLQGDVEMRPVDETEEEDDDFHEAILKSDFDFEFDFAFGQRQLAAARRRLENGSSLADELDLFDEEVDTPATTPRSPVIDDNGNPELYEMANEAAKQQEASRNGEMILLGLEKADGAVQETLAGESHRSFVACQRLTVTDVLTDTYKSRSPSPAFQDDSHSPALPIPALPIVKAVSSSGFGPAGTAPNEDDLAEAESMSSSFSDLAALQPFGEPRSFSPTASSISSFNGEMDTLKDEMDMLSQAASPACSNDSFDVEVVTGAVKQEGEMDSSLSPSAFGMEELVAVEDAQGEENLHIAMPTDVAMDELDLEFGGPVTPPPEWNHLGATPPPTPFGPEVYGFFSAPQMEWHVPPAVTPLCEADSAMGLELGPGLEGSDDVDMDSQDATEKLRSALEAATSAEAVANASAKEDKPASSLEEAAEITEAPKVKPVLQRRVSVTQPADPKAIKIQDAIKPVRVVSTRSTRANPQATKPVETTKPAGSVKVNKPAEAKLIKPVVEPVVAAEAEKPAKPVTRRSSRRTSKN